jgi:predicted ATPase
VKVLATSRIPLGLYGEHEYAVPPLSVPDPKRLPTVTILSQYEAVRLFIDRAGAARAGFSITNENAPAIAELCARLDGLPLAIELAAARIKILPPKALLSRLSNRLKLLTGGAKDLPARQRTLRGAIEWSHDLLAKEDRTLFRRMAVFAGGRTLEAMEAVCAPEGEPDVLDGVQSLVEKSLLRQEEGPQAEPRFVMLETIHEYAREKLEESGETEEISRAHAAYFLSLAEEAEPELKGPGQIGWLERLEAEHDNFRAALSWSLGSGETELALRLAGALWWFWHVRGHWSEGTGWLERALSASGGGAPASRARTLYALGWMTSWQGDCERAEMLSAESLALHRELQDVLGIAGDLSSLGWTAMLKGDTERASRLLKESLALLQEARDDHSMSRTLQGLAWVAYGRGDFERSDVLLEESLALSRKQGDVREVANSLNDLGLNAIYQGDHERAAALLEEALSLRWELGDRIGLAANLNALGMAALGRGDPKVAKSLIVESLTLSSVLGHDLLVAENLEVMAAVTGMRGEGAGAARLWGAAEALREATDALLSPPEVALRDSYAAAARSRLGEEAWKRAWEEGRAMTFEEAVAFALEGGADG